MNVMAFQITGNPTAISTTCWGFQQIQNWAPITGSLREVSTQMVTNAERIAMSGRIYISGDD